MVSSSVWIIQELRWVNKKRGSGGRMLDLRNQGVKLKNNKFNQHFTSDNISIFMANSISIPQNEKGLLY